jgi:predicted TIM-barrel fold metal-dependent hydrolase
MKSSRSRRRTTGRSVRRPASRTGWPLFVALIHSGTTRSTRSAGARARGVTGLKLHFGNSGVDVLNADHVEKLRRVFAAANERRLPIVAHLWTMQNYGRADAEVFLERILPMAPDVPVQIAHFAGGGPGYTDPALAIYAAAIANGNPATRNLYFDIAGVASFQPSAVLRTFAERIRQVGLARVLWGTDVGVPQESWRLFQTTVPLTAEEIATIASNIAPYLRAR